MPGRGTNRTTPLLIASSKRMWYG
uniref:Uncharacterized protein n=1 Tax=Arundo donax TaxID=35708 RepID=A0A0A9F0P1_ARUDO